MGSFHIVKSKIIKAPIDRVFNTLNDFHSWKKWSPWLIADPNADVDVRPDGKYYEWKGDRVGAGNMNITKEEENQSIHCDLLFLKPWKSKAKTYFILSEVEEGTKVEWNMDSSLPWFMFMMRKMMITMIGNDYDLGLKMLKDYVEDGKVHSELIFHGEQSYPGCKYIGIKREISMDDTSKAMGEDFEKLGKMAQEIEGTKIQESFCVYHKWDFVKNRAVYTVGLPIENEPSKLPEGTFMGEMPATKVYQIEHVGPYEHLGNAWTTAHSVMRNKEYKANKKIHPFETYGNSPSDTDPKELRTFVNFAMK